MKKLLYIIIFTQICFAQPKLDSLLLALNPLEETVQVQTLSELCWEYRSRAPEVSINYGMEALKLIDSFSLTEYKAQTLNYLGVIYGNLGDLDSAFYYYQNAMEIAEETGDSIQIAYSFNNLGDYYFKNALYSIALEKIFSSYNIFEKLNDKQGMAYCQNDIGEIYLKQKDYDKALPFFEESSKIRIQLNDERGCAKSMVNIATVYAEKNMYEKALEYYDRAMLYSESSDYVKGKSWVLAGESDIYYRQGEYQKALKKRNEALEIDRQISNKYGEIINYNQIGMIYLALKNRILAKSYFEKAKAESEATGHIDQLMKAYEYLTNIAVDENNYKLAFEYDKQFEVLKDSIYSHETVNRIADLQSAFVIERKDRENETLRKKIEYEKTTSNFLILVTLLILVGVVLVISRYKSAREANMLLRELNESKDKFFSIIAHDLKNPFGAVSNIAALLEQEYDEMDDAERKSLINSIASASQEIQNLLMDLLTWARSQKGEINIKKEIINVREILNTLSRTYELLAKNKNISIVVETEEELVINADKFILETVIGNLVNNAIKFSHNGSEVVLKGKKNGKDVIFSVKDNGVGIEKSVLDKLFILKNYSTKGTKKEKGTGLGLKICKEFTELHGGTIDVESTPGKGSLFSVTIPV